MEKYQKVRVLGKGSFGNAILIKRKSDGSLFVVKEVSLIKMSKKERDEARHECTVLQQLKHPNIVRYIEHFENHNNLYIVMEYCDGGDLSEKLKQARGAMKESSILYYFSQICLAMEYLHSRHILHRDIKTMNVFLMKNGAVKLGDFGISTVLRNTMGMANTVCGTPYYFSPELCRNKPYNNKSDIWALGILLYECATGGRHPFDGNNMNQLMQRIVKGQFAPLSSQYSPEFRKMVEWCLQKDSAQRPNIKQTLSLPLMRRSLEQLEENLMLATQCRVRLKDIMDFETNLGGQNKTNEDNMKGDVSSVAVSPGCTPGLSPGQAAALAVAQQASPPLVPPKVLGAVVGPKPGVANVKNLNKFKLNQNNPFSPFHNQIMQNLAQRQAKLNAALAPATPVALSPPVSPYAKQSPSKAEPSPAPADPPVNAQPSPRVGDYQLDMKRVDAIIAKYGQNVDIRAKETIHAYMRRKQEEYQRRQKEELEKRERRNELRQKELKRVLAQQRRIALGLVNAPDAVNDNNSNVNNNNNNNNNPNSNPAPKFVKPANLLLHVAESPLSPPFGQRLNGNGAAAEPAGSEHQPLAAPFRAPLVDPLPGQPRLFGRDPKSMPCASPLIKGNKVSPSRKVVLAANSPRVAFGVAGDKQNAQVKRPLENALPDQGACPTTAPANAAGALGSDQRELRSAADKPRGGVPLNADPVLVSGVTPRGNAAALAAANHNLVKKAQVEQEKHISSLVIDSCAVKPKRDRGAAEAAAALRVVQDDMVIKAVKMPCSSASSPFQMHHLKPQRANPTRVVTKAKQPAPFVSYANPFAMPRRARVDERQERPTLAVSPRRLEAISPLIDPQQKKPAVPSAQSSAAPTPTRPRSGPALLDTAEVPLFSRVSPPALLSDLQHHQAQRNPTLTPLSSPFLSPSAARSPRQLPSKGANPREEGPTQLSDLAQQQQQQRERERRRKAVLPPMNAEKLAQGVPAERESLGMTDAELIDVPYGVRKGSDKSFSPVQDALRILRKKNSLCPPDGPPGARSIHRGGPAKSDLRNVFYPANNASPQLYPRQPLLGEAARYAGMARGPNTSAEKAALFGYRNRQKENHDRECVMPSTLETLRTLRSILVTSEEEESSSNLSGQLALLKQRHLRKPEYPPLASNGTSEANQLRRRSSGSTASSIAQERSRCFSDHSLHHNHLNKSESNGASESLRGLVLSPVRSPTDEEGRITRGNSVEGYAEMLRHLKGLLQKRKIQRNTAPRTERTASGGTSNKGASPNGYLSKCLQDDYVLSGRGSVFSSEHETTSPRTLLFTAPLKEEQAKPRRAPSAGASSVVSTDGEELNEDNSNAVDDDETEDFEDAVPLSPVRCTEKNDIYTRLNAEKGVAVKNRRADVDDVYTDDVFLGLGGLKEEEEGEEGYTLSF